MTATITATVVIVCAVVVGVGWRAPDPLGVPPAAVALVIAVAVVIAERHRVHLHAGRETASFSLAELPTAVGLFLLSPVLLVAARAVGVAFALARIHRRSPVKLAFNIANGALEATVAVVVFNLLATRPGSAGWVYLAALVAMACASATGITAVWLVIRIVEGVRRLSQLGDALKMGLPIGVGNAAIGLSLVLVLSVDPWLLWIPIVPLGVLVLAYRAYAAQWRQKDTLTFLYDTAVDAHAHPRLDDALLELIRGCRAHMRAEVAEAVVVPRPGGSTALVVSADSTGAEEIRTVDLTSLPLETRRRMLPDAPEQHLSAETVSVRSDAGEGGWIVLTCRHPVGNEASFATGDLDALRALARLAVIAVDRSEFDEMKSAFLSAVSHELRTPLTVVMGAAATLKTHGEALSDEQHTQFIDRLDQQARKLNRLLGDLLDLDRLARGLVAPRRRTVDLVDLARRVVETFDHEEHVLRVEGRPLSADIDPALIERVVENLVRNAVKYSPAGSLVTVDISETPGAVAIAVEDQGAGIPEHARAQVLDPFVRLDRDNPQPGTGVGLTLVQRFAQLHEGEVTIEEGRDGGARIVVRLPQPEHERPPLQIVPAV